MGKKRKRPIKDVQRSEDSLQQKLPKTNISSAFKPDGASASDADGHSHPVISLYYRQVVSLRQYILHRIPRSSKARRRRIASVRSDNGIKTTFNDGDKAPTQDLAYLLDTTLVGIWKELPPTCSQERRQGFIAFTQSQHTSQIPGTDIGPPCPQSEIVDFVISSLFSRCGFSYQRPQHLLTHGFRAGGSSEKHTLPCSIPGILAQFPNKSVEMLKKAPWTEVLNLLGSNGDDIMLRLLLDCGLFVAVDAKKGIYCQISGLPLSTLDPVSNMPQANTLLAKPECTRGQSLPILAPDPKPNTGRKTNVISTTATTKTIVPGLNTIVFCHRRILYARPHLDSNGAIKWGLANHILNRISSADSLSQTLHVLKYIFPKQFSLHNVFTVDPNSRDNGAPRDYSSREDEIAKLEEIRGVRHRRAPRQTRNTGDQREFSKIPKRLREKGVELAQHLQSRHKRCSYRELLKYYCPLECAGPWRMGIRDTQAGAYAGEPTSPASFPLITQPSVPRQDSPRRTKRTDPRKISSKGNPLDSGLRSMAVKPKISLTDYATPAAAVSAFSQAVIRNLVPSRFFGTGQYLVAHQRVILKQVDRFIHMRRFESLSLHEVTRIPWLRPPGMNQNSTDSKTSISDLLKRKELFYEFIYYIFDSILIPLIRGNFYVTESQTHRNRLFYFRHDVWRRLTAQPLTQLKCAMFEELKPETAKSVLGRRPLGYGSLRLLPKITGIRPILNLRRRMVKETRWAGKTRQILGKSVNSAIAPIQSVLNYEKAQRADLIGSGMCSVGDMHGRLKAFKESLLARQIWDLQTPFFFVKLDIQSCFDTIPQDSLISLIQKLVSEETYHFMKYVEMRPANEFGGMWASRKPEPSKTGRKFGGRVAPMRKPEHLMEAVARGDMKRRRNTVFMDMLAQNEYNSEDLLDLLDEHVRNNLVKIGKRYFRQRNGIPQGSVLSSTLCNLFYAQMERETLGFLDSDNALLLRLVDDFLLITSDCDLATRFLRVMIHGQPAYGVSVNPAKSLVNFAVSVDGTQIPRLVDTPLFPYCGSLIDTRTLEIFKDQDRVIDGGDSVATALSDSLTIESTRTPGRTFHRKVLASLKLFMHPMYLDSAHNSFTAVLSNLYTNFIISAMRMYRYMRSLPRRVQLATGVVIRTIRDVIQLAYRMIRARHDLKHCGGGPNGSLPRLTCTVSHFQVQFLATAAFQFVLGQKQTRHSDVVHWLGLMLKKAQLNPAGDTVLLSQVVRSGNLLYGGWRF